MYMSGEEACGVRGEGVRPRVGPKERTSLGTRIDSLSLSRSLALLSRVVPCCTQLFIAGAAVPVALRAVALRGPPRGKNRTGGGAGGYIMFSNLCVHILTKKTFVTKTRAWAASRAAPPCSAQGGAAQHALPHALP